MTSLYWPYLIADYYRIVEVLTAIVGVLIFLSSLDDLFVDGWYWVRRIRRRFTVKSRYMPLSEAQLRARPEQRLVIMVPAWQEYDVVAQMLESMVSTLDYHAYNIFVGTYRNDARTIREVERMRLRYRHLVRVEVPHDGPTCKADCLNWVVQAVFSYEQQHQVQFAGVVLHDSEDVLHPLELKYFNYLLPRIDFIQLPVASLERKWYELVAGTYMDEFAESHAKDMVVRESMTRTVPSAGVGTCFSRKALAELASQTDNQPFNTDTLTEDYDVGARLGRLGMKQIFGIFPVDYVAQRASVLGDGRETLHVMSLPLSVREYFPNTFRTAYRQKARWLLGIAFQGWELVNWQGSLAGKYMLFRDRKALFTSFIAILAYVLLVHFLVFYGLHAAGLLTVFYPSVFPGGGWWATLMALNGVVLFLRAAQRFYFVTRLYGWRHGLLSIPRVVIGNFVNAMAAARAWHLYFGHVLSGRRLVWDKTMHDFPSVEQLVNQRQLLGDLLLSWRAIDAERLEQALGIQKTAGGKLGEILIHQGWLDDETLREAMRMQEAADGRDAAELETERAQAHEEIHE